MVRVNLIDFMKHRTYALTKSYTEKSKS